MVKKNETNGYNIPYELILEFSDEGAILLENNSIVYLNKKGAEILGAESPDDLIGFSSAYFMTPDCYALDGEKVILNKEWSKEKQYLTIPIQDALGYKKMIKYYMSRFETDGKKLTFAVFRDETPFIYQEAQISKFMQAVDSNPMQIIMTDLNGNIEYVNQSFIDTMGYGVEEVIGQNPRMYNSGSQDPIFYKYMWDTLKNGDVWKGYFENIKKDGNTFWVSATITPIKDTEGNIINYLAMEEDISDKMDMAKSLDERNTELNKLIEELGEAQNQLIQKEKLAGIGELAAGVAHEINNPLGFIISNTSTLKSYSDKLLGFVDLSKQLLSYIENEDHFERDATIDALKALDDKYDLDFLKEDLEDLFNDMDEGLQRVKKIVHGLRMFSRVDQNEENNKYNMNEGIKDTLVVANNEIKYDATIELDLNEGLPEIHANGGQLNQVLLNLLINAVHAIRAKEDGMGSIHIKTDLVDEYVECAITDSGTGMDKKTMKKIFNPFFTTKPMGIGTGLGLSISFDIVTNKHEGYLKVESTLGVGTTFRIGLPINSLRKEEEHEEAETFVRR